MKMKTKKRQIVILAGLFILAVVVFTLIVQPAEETKRFELRFSAITSDNIEINIRAFGDYVKRFNIGPEIVKFKEAMLEQISKMENAEITNKMKLQFRDLVNEAEERGINIDSLSHSEEEK